MLLNKTHALFENVQRITTEELNVIVESLKQKLLLTIFKRMEPSHALPSKETHGDVDIICLIDENINLHDELYKFLSPDILDYHRNGYIYSIKYNSREVNKFVHVDFIACSDEKIYETHCQYYSFNDAFGVLGIMSKQLNYKIATHGFFKRFRDEKNNWHDIPITNDLMIGLEILGYRNSKLRYYQMQNYDDIVNFVLSSSLCDIVFFVHEEMNQSDRKSMRRPVIEYVVNKIRDNNPKRTTMDDDHFLKELYPEKYKFVLDEQKRINEGLLSMSKKYDGNWIMKNFNLKPSPQIGIILKNLSNSFGTQIDSIPEETIKNFIKENKFDF